MIHFTKFLYFFVILSPINDCEIMKENVMNGTVTAFLKVSHNLVRTGMYSFLFVRLGIMSRGPDRTFQGAVYGPRAVVCTSLT